MNLSKLWKIVKDREFWHAAVYGVAKKTEETVAKKTRLKRLKSNNILCLNLYHPV